MVTLVNEQSYLRKSALIAGISLIIMTVASFFSMALSMEALWCRGM